MWFRRVKLLGGRVRSLTPSGGLLRGGQRGGQLLVKLEQELDPFAVALELLRPVAKVNGTVERGVRLREIGRHRERVVQRGKRRIRELRPRVENPLRRCLHRRALLVR